MINKFSGLTTKLSRFLVLGICVVLAACESVGTLIRNAETIAEAQGFDSHYIQANNLWLRAFVSIKNSNLPVRVYIEGDGRAWITRRRMSTNPTPKNPVALKLALADARSYPNVIYLARPCQFVEGQYWQGCQWQYWTSHRYGESVVNAMDQAIDRLIDENAFSSLELVGYSGGGALAVLLAARRDDVTFIRTVAGNLNTDLFTSLHQVSPLTHSLNPLNFAAEVASIPQVHHVGGEDTVVPPLLARSFMAAVKGQCARLNEVAGVGHSGWAAVWSQQLLIDCSAP